MTIPWALQVRGDLPARLPAAAACEGDAGEGSPRMEVRPRDQDPVTQAAIPGAGARRWLRALDCLRSGGVASHTAQTQNDNESSKLGRPRRCSPFASVSDHRL
jgi:hypothetical protein